MAATSTHPLPWFPLAAQRFLAFWQQWSCSSPCNCTDLVSSHLATDTEAEAEAETEAEAEAKAEAEVYTVSLVGIDGEPHARKYTGNTRIVKVLTEYSDCKGREYYLMLPFINTENRPVSLKDNVASVYRRAKSYDNVLTVSVVIGTIGQIPPSVIWGQAATWEFLRALIRLRKGLSIEYVAQLKRERTFLKSTLKAVKERISKIQEEKEHEQPDIKEPQTKFSEQLLVSLLKLSRSEIKEHQKLDIMRQLQTTLQKVKQDIANIEKEISLKGSTFGDIMDLQGSGLIDCPICDAAATGRLRLYVELLIPKLCRQFDLHELQFKQQEVFEHRLFEQEVSEQEVSERL